MNYKYKKGQLFGKRLKVPKYILSKIYNCTLSLEEFMEYQLFDKIPATCLFEVDREIVERFGIQKMKELDFELFRKSSYNDVVFFKETLKEIDSSTEDINFSLYEQIKDQISPLKYSTKMKEVYQNRFFSEEEEKELKYIASEFNRGAASLIDFIQNWELYKDKDLSYCLRNDSNNKFHITDEQVKKFMSKFSDISKLISRQTDLYQVISEINKLKSEVETKEYIKQITDQILEKTRVKNSRSISLRQEEYQALFQYSSVEEYLNKVHPSYEFEITKILEELKDLPSNYLFDSSIPFEKLNNSNVISFLSFYGVQNIIDFDNQCGHFFTKDNCLGLELMVPMYLRYAGNEHDSRKTILTKSFYDENGNFVDRRYTKEEFYEAVRRMIVYGPTNFDYMNKALDYREIEGDFREKNSDLFISKQAPLELQEKFYQKVITPHFLAIHREYLPYLKEKNFGSCFKNREIQVEDSENLYGCENFYDFLKQKMDFDYFMDFIIEYRDVFDVIFRNSILDNDEFKIFQADNINQLVSKFHGILRKTIIEKEIIYPDLIPQSFVTEYPDMFLSDLAPEELKQAFYQRRISPKTIFSNPNYQEYLKDVDLEALYKYMPIFIQKEDQRYYSTNFVEVVKKTFSHEDAFSFMVEYGPYVDSIYQLNNLREFRLKNDFKKEDLLNEVDHNLLKEIIDGKIKYEENAPSHFKSNHPTLFLNSDVPLEIRQKFYDRKFSLNDFKENPNLLNLFGNTNVACGFSYEFSWIISLFNKNEDSNEANLHRLKIIEAYSKVTDVVLQSAFREYVMEFPDSFDLDKVEHISTVLARLSSSNSSEIFTFRKELAVQILNSKDPIESLNKIEDVFIKNNIPTVGKVYSCFEILHPNLEEFDFKESMVSPILQNSSTMGRKTIIFSDLLKASFGSNNRIIHAYLKNIEVASKLYKNIKSGFVQFDNLSEVEKKELVTFSKHLATLYQNTMRGKAKEERFSFTENVIDDISRLAEKFSPNGTLDYNLSDRVVRMFCGFIGIDTLEQAKDYINRSIENANIRNRNASNLKMELKVGDFVKGIGNITYLRNILQNGSVSKEYLGSSAGSDLTPLDTDVSMVISEEGTIKEKVSRTNAKNYGPIWFILKNDNRFDITRTKEGSSNTKKDMSKLEAFYTGVLGYDHYGIRTGFSSSEINYILMEDYNPAVGLEICMNGFYIPVVDMTGELLFTPQDYDQLREKMSGLSYYNENDYKFSKNLMAGVPDILLEQIEQSSYDTKMKKAKINEVIGKSLNELGLELKTTMDGDLTEGFVELIDTGSTGRGTNRPGEGDFDFMMRLDKSLLSDSSKLETLKNTILKNLGKEGSNEITSSGDFRFKNVNINAEINVDIDITFTEKTDKVTYSTDVSLVDRLTCIQKNSPEKYPYVVANILLAKQVLKEAGVYKSGHSDHPQGGLGGVGIENWILQNGGSFIDAAKSFVDASLNKDFDEFKKEYQIWDFGDNHLADKRGKYPHDNFVCDNMTEAGYYKMVSVLQEYLKNYNYSDVMDENHSVHR